MAGAAIEVEDVECRYGQRAILRDVTFRVGEGELFFVVGGNGSGKSTLLRHMIGLEEPAAGRISYFGRTLTGAPPSESRSVRREFGVLFQNNALWSSKTVGENIELPLQQHSRLSPGERRDIVALKLARVGLAGCEERWPSELSGGMAKRAAFARALALDPRIVFLDEPTAGLDPVHAAELDELIVETRDTFGTTMVIVTHDTKRIAALADRMVFLHADCTGVIAEGTPGELMTDHEDERVREFFAADKKADKGAGGAP